MAPSTYCINTTLVSNGLTSKVDYCPHDNGHLQPGFVTSVSEYREYLGKNLFTGKLQLYVIGKSGKIKSIGSDDDLRKCVEHLPSRGVLSVSAVEEDPPGKSRSRSRAYSKKESHGAKTNKSSNKEKKEKHSKDEMPGNASDVSDDDSMMVIEATKARLHDILKRFGVFTEDNCYHCGTKSWRSKRYRFVANTKYSLCPSCYKDLSDPEKDDWAIVPSGLHWKNDVPEFPLSIGSGYGNDDEEEQVTHLQYLLTRLGFMKLSATNKLVGSFQERTAQGVEKLREKYNIVGTRDEDGDGMGLYDEKTANQLLKIVRAYRKKGHRYI